MKEFKMKITTIFMVIFLAVVAAYLLPHITSSISTSNKYREFKAKSALVDEYYKADIQKKVANGEIDLFKSYYESLFIIQQTIIIILILVITIILIVKIINSDEYSKQKKLTKETNDFQQNNS